MGFRGSASGSDAVAKQKRDPKLEKFWRKTIRRRERSGLTVVGFCREEGLSASSYHFWKREIRRRDEAQELPRSAPSTSVTPSLVPVKVVEDRGPTGVEVVAPNGLVVRIPEGATADHVSRILQLVHQIS